MWLKVKNRFPVAVAKFWCSLAYDATTNRLFVVQRDRESIGVMDATTGAVITHFSAILSVGDIYFDPASREVYVTCEQGHLDVYREAGTKYTNGSGVPAEVGVSVFAFDPRTRKLFLPLVELKCSDPNCSLPLVPKPGSSVVIVIA